MNKKEQCFEVLNIIKENGNISKSTAYNYLICMHELSEEEAICVVNEWMQLRKDNRLK